MGDLSDHFDSAEFRCRGYLLKGHRPHETLVLPALVHALEHLRENEGGRPLRIVSGHRCAWYNAWVDGARFSQHLRGAAADIPAGYAMVGAAARAGFRGIGCRGLWAVHVDVRRSPARWVY